MKKMTKIKNAVLYGLGLNATDGQIREHKKLRRQLDQRKDDLDRLNPILKNLKKKYKLHRHQIFFIRYELMKRMIKSAVEEVRMALDDLHWLCQNQSTELEDDGQGGTREFFETCKKIAANEKYYSELTAAQVDKELRDLRAQIKQLGEEFSSKRALLEHLGIEYQKCKSWDYLRRYKEMKKMIKDTVRPTS